MAYEQGNRLNLSAALRYERYPGVASIATPKLGLIYAPAADLAFKGSWGRSFRAPTLYQQYAIRGISLYTAGALGGSCYPADASVMLVSGGNPAIRPERAESWTVSAAYTPHQLPGLRLELSYFSTIYRDRIVTPITYSAQSLSNPHRILLTDDVLHGCVMPGAGLLCTSENAVSPRRVVMIDLETGRQRVLFDPNPEFRHLLLGSVTRLTWRNAIGLPAWGDLVLPPAYRPGTRLPMVVVQYHSDGFLRGGTGDEYPIQAFAARGFAVLSLERPPTFGSNDPAIRDWNELNAAGVRDWSERRSLLSSLVTGVEQVIARGIADPARIGITGLSDGASGARFALVNTRLFAAASISTCCTDTRAMMTNGGTGFADAMRAIGYPPSITEHPEFWMPYSLTLNARRMTTPLLMQVADDELNFSLETFTALREAGQPVEMYVFPGEHHIKMQPWHRRAIYERNLDWFAFWLQGKVDADPAKAGQFARWQAMKAKLAQGGAPP